MEIIRFAFVHLIIPGVGLWVYRRLCKLMRDNNTSHPPCIPLLAVFVVYGGWLMIFLTLQLWYWSGMALLGAAFLMFVAPIIMLALSVMLFLSRKMSPYHSGLFIASAFYVCADLSLVIWFVTK